MFGNDLELVPKDPNGSGFGIERKLLGHPCEGLLFSCSLPEFVVRCVGRIESVAAGTEGIYRVNGDAAAVQKIR